MTETLKELMKSAGFTKLSEAAGIFEMTATEWLDSGDKEIASEYMMMAALLREHERALKALQDCHMIAVRRGRGVATPENADWHHIRRFCEKHIHVSILRHD